MGCPLARTVKNYIDLDDSPAQSARDAGRMRLTPIWG